jgi:hypothetical protein
MMLCRIILSSTIAWLTAASTYAQQGTPSQNDPSAKVDFQKDVRPILAEHCIGCHGPHEPQAGVSFTSRESLLKHADSGKPVLHEHALEDSELLKRIASADLSQRMPPEDKKPLSHQEIETLRAWVLQGARWDTHWSFRPIVAPNVPIENDSTGHVHPIDLFVIQGLLQTNWTLSHEASRPVLLKRLSYDLIGLPPSLDEIDEFVNDESPFAYERLVDRLLESPHFGERWGRHWLDLAHFADSDGYEKDRERPDAFRYRDWVIQSLNQDMPFDQFTIEQLAGDLLPNATSQSRLATAFLRQTLTNEEGGVDQEEYRVAACFDRTETVGTVWLGLTIGCVRCHGHKYDPLPHDDYYKLFAFFNNSDESNEALAVQASQLDEYEEQARPLLARKTAREKALRSAATRWETETRQRLLKISEAKSNEQKKQNRNEIVGESNIANFLEMYPEKRVADAKQKLFEYYLTKVAADSEWLQLRDDLESLQKRFGVQMKKLRTISDALERRETFVFDRGEFLSPTKRVEADTPEVLPKMNGSDSVRNRYDLACWLVSHENPLTARVTVNQIWSHLFGKGLVRTIDDLGVRGEPPTHPELFDYLASRFQGDLGWSRKALIRLIVTSATYKQRSHHRPDYEQLDPENRRLFRQNRFRVEAETIRDLTLAVSGLLSKKIGGPSVFPPMPEELAKLSYANSFSWKTSEGDDRYRRGMYTFFKRTIPHPALMTFDAPDANVACVARNVSNTPLQSLTLLNNESHAEAAQSFARRILNESLTEKNGEYSSEQANRLAIAMRWCTVRQPTTGEVDALVRLLQRNRDFYAADKELARQMSGDKEVSSDEFLTRE